jgi:hypothetical protein
MSGLGVTGVVLRVLVTWARRGWAAGELRTEIVAHFAAKYGLNKKVM